MSYKRILKALTDLGLSQTDAEVYVFLANRGPQKMARIAAELKLQEQLLCCSLESLAGKGIIDSTHEHSALFYALPFKAALEKLVEEQLKKVQVVEENKNDAIFRWKNMTKGSTN